MAEIIRRSKPLSVSPLKTSQPLGASLAILGLNRAIPLLHGAQGCTAFAKVFLVRHFREPIPLQTSALDPISSIMGADDSLLAGDLAAQVVEVTSAVEATALTARPA